MFSGFNCLPKTESYESHHLAGLWVFSPAFSLSQYLSLSFVFSLSGFSHHIISCDLDKPKRFFYMFPFQWSVSIFINLFYNVDHRLMKIHHSILMDSWFHLMSSFHLGGRNRLGIFWDFNNQVINKEIKILEQKRSCEDRREILEMSSLQTLQVSLTLTGLCKIERSFYSQFFLYRRAEVTGTYKFSVIFQANGVGTGNPSLPCCRRHKSAKV